MKEVIAIKKDVKVEFEIIDGVPMVDSRSVAKNFGVIHSKFIKKIEKSLFYDDFINSNKLVSSSYINYFGDKSDMYFLNRDALFYFTISCTGIKAVKWKVYYTKLFNLVEKNLHSYQISDPIKRAEKWIKEQKEKMALEDKIRENKHQINSQLHICEHIKEKTKKVLDYYFNIKNKVFK